VSLILSSFNLIFFQSILRLPFLILAVAVAQCQSLSRSQICLLILLSQKSGNSSVRLGPSTPSKLLVENVSQAIRMRSRYCLFLALYKCPFTMMLLPLFALSRALRSRRDTNCAWNFSYRRWMAIQVRSKRWIFGSSMFLASSWPHQTRCCLIILYYSGAFKVRNGLYSHETVQSSALFYNCHFSYRDLSFVWISLSLLSIKNLISSNSIALAYSLHMLS